MAIYTKPRSEKKVAERLTQKGFEIYCPLQTVIRQWSDRKKKVKTPVFPSYVFVCVEESERVEILHDLGVLNFVFWLGKPAVISEKEINAIKEFLGEYEGEEIEIQQFEKGQEVHIQFGPLSGQKGVVHEQDRNQVYLLVESLGMVIKVKLRSEYIQIKR